MSCDTKVECTSTSLNLEEFERMPANEYMNLHTI